MAILDQVRRRLDALTGDQEAEALNLEAATVEVLLRFGDGDAARRRAAQLLPRLERVIDDNDMDPRRTTPWVRLVTNPELALYDEAEHGARLSAIRATGLAIPGLWPAPAGAP